MFFFFNDTATPEIYTLSLHDALPIFPPRVVPRRGPDHFDRPGRDSREPPAGCDPPVALGPVRLVGNAIPVPRHGSTDQRSEEHTSELQSRQYLVCRLLLEKKKNYTII